MPLAASLARSSVRSNQAQMMAMRGSFSSGPGRAQYTVCTFGNCGPGYYHSPPLLHWCLLVCYDV